MSLALLAAELGRLGLIEQAQPLGEWPTPVTRLAALGDELGVELWIKRDDLSGARYGGNKLRKLELLLGAALAADAKSLVTVGGAGSNHLVATALYGRQLGLPLHAVVFPQPETDHVDQIAAQLRQLEVDLVPCGSRLGVPFAWQRAKRRAHRPYTVGPGGSSPLGTVGYVAAALELRQQIDAGELAAPDVIYVALGSGGTFAGLRLGCALAGVEADLVGVRVVERALVNATTVRWLERRTRRLLERASGRTLPRGPRMRIEHGQIGRCYGDPTTTSREAVARAGAHGQRLETTYTGKAFAALIAAGASAGRRVLFWNTFNSRKLLL